LNPGRSQHTDALGHAVVENLQQAVVRYHASEGLDPGLGVMHAHRTRVSRLVYVDVADRHRPPCRHGIPNTKLFEAEAGTEGKCDHALR